MSSSILYKCNKVAVCYSKHEDLIIDNFLSYIRSEQNTYYESADDLEDAYCEGEESEVFKVLNKFMVDNNLYGFDLVVE